MNQICHEAINSDYIHSSKRDLEQILVALESRVLTGKAEIVAEYEQALSDFFSSKFAIATSSGSTAIQAALYSLGVREGDEVLVPALSVLPSVFPVSANGAKCVLVDSRPASLDFDPQDLKRKITRKTKAALVAPLWGYPIDLSETRQFLDEHEIPLIEDAAHAHGAQIGSQSIGTQGAFGCFSTHDRKILSTGEGGFLLTDNEELARIALDFSRLRGLSDHSWGVNYRFNALAAALGLARLHDLPDLLEHRRRNAAVIQNALSKSSSIKELNYAEGGTPNYYNFVLDIDPEHGRVIELKTALDAVGIRCDKDRYGFDVLYKRPSYKDPDIVCPQAEHFLSRILQLPVHPGMSQEELETIASIVKHYS